MDEHDPYIKIVDACGKVLIVLILLLIPINIVNQLGQWKGWW